jgi:HK97 family phage prohead protease
VHKIKSSPLVGFKALPLEAEGTFEAIVSVFGNVDYAGDRILAGAFAGSLERWKSSGDPIPVVFSHQWDDLDAHVGVVLEAKELLPGDPLLVGTGLEGNGGLWIKARLDVDEDFARRLWKRLERRSIREFSFAYDVIDERRSSDGANDLVELDVIEVGPTLKGMNPATVLVTAKSLAARILAAKSDDPAELEALIAEELEDVEVEVETADDVETKSTPAHAFIPGDEDPSRCSVCELTRNTTGHLHALSGEAGGAKAVVALAGSVEERLGRIQAAAVDALDAAGALDAADGGVYDVAAEGTFDDRVVYRVEGWNDPIGGGRFYELSIEAETDDEVALGEPVEVVLEATTRPKSISHEWSSGVLSAAKALRSGTVRDDGNHEGKSDGKAEDRSGGKAEDRKTRTGTETGSTGEASRLLLELDDLELAET